MIDEGLTKFAREEGLQNIIVRNHSGFYSVWEDGLPLYQDIDSEEECREKIIHYAKMFNSLP